MSSNIIGPSPNKLVIPSEKIAPSEGVEKGSGTLDYTEEPVIMGNAKIIEELELKSCNDSVTSNIKKKIKGRVG